MSSVSGGSELSFFGHGKSGANVNIDLTTNGQGDQPAPVNGKLNIEVFTATAGSLAPGYDASILVPGATLVDNNTVTNVGQQNVTEVLLTGSFRVVDETGNESISIQGAAGDNMTVVGSLGDTIMGSANAAVSQLIDASNKNKSTVDGPETIIGGAGPTTVLAGAGDSIVGGSGDMLIRGGSHDTIIGGSGSITIKGGSDDSIVAGSGGIISVRGHGGGDHDKGNGKDDDDRLSRGLSTVPGGAGHDTIAGGDRTATHGTNGQDTIAGTQGFTFLDPGQGASTVMGFNTDTDLIQSATSVSATGTFLGSSTSNSAGTTITFVDGSTMFLAGVANLNQIKFTQ